MDITITSSNNKAIKLKAMEQLLEGHEFTTQLQQLISQPGFFSSQGLAKNLVAKILGSFNNIISTLDSLEPISSSSSLVPTGEENSQNASCDGKSEDSGDSRKRLAPVKGKRGCYKRKKRSETWTVESTVLEDSFSWRKYGQKEILNTKFPRGYFRCTHKFTQGCKATKQVQKLEQEPLMFSITYIGNHTCNTHEPKPKPKPKTKPCDDHHHDEIIMDSEEQKSPSLTISVKEEEEKHQGSSTANDLSLVWQDIVFEDNHHHEAIYACGEASATINVLCSTDLMLFGTSCSNFGFNDNEPLSYFGSC